MLRRIMGQTTMLLEIPLGEDKLGESGEKRVYIDD